MSETQERFRWTVRDLSVLAYTQGFTLWIYKTDAPLCAVLAGDPSDLVDMLTSGDMVLISAQDGGAAATAAVVGTRLHLVPICQEGAPS